MASFKLSATEHPIKAVTVYKSSRAEVVRVFPLKLQSGNTKIDITELPSCIDTHSVRVSGLGEARLFDVVCTTRNKTPGTKPTEAIQQLRVQKTALQGEKRVYDYESDLLVSYAKTLKGEHVSPSQMGVFLQSFVESGKRNLVAVAEIDEKIADIDRQLEQELEKQAVKKGDATGLVTVVVGTDVPVSVELKLTYIVSSASWSSTYELHASTDNGKPSSAVTLHYRARITQSTGEDWSDTALTLSTVDASTMVRNIPYLSPIKIRPQNRGLFFTQKNNNAGPIFGAPNQPPQVPGISNVHKTPAGLIPAAFNGNRGSNALFGTPSQSLFGSGTSTASAQQTTGGSSDQGQSFGITQTTQPASGLFGSAPTGGLFGSTQSATTGGLFGSTQSATTGGLFGSTQPATTGGLFGSTQPANAGGLFGGAAPAAPAVLASQLASTSLHDSEITEEFEEIAIPGAQAGPTTIVTETPLAVSYAVEGTTTVPSDGTAHQVAVAVLPFEAKIKHICTPRIDARVYLQCNVKNTSEYRLLPGPVTVVLNDSFVSKTSINEIATGDTFACTLGDDAAAKVTYSRSSKTKKLDSGSFAESLNSTTYTTKITIHNKHPFALTDLVVRDIVPTSDDTRAKVLLHKPAGLADAKDGQVVKVDSASLSGLTVRWGAGADGKPGEKEGRIEWGWNVEPGNKAVLEAEWELKAPADVTWVEYMPLFGAQWQ
ncbi:hypothetical protein MIND_00658100 [Mycena indigotica]|uniref:DUF4139 domain-containing protein n=1 Tax=Mycena indigotica TaxID=2126181 RepID=A0A8H6SKA2_9AGAR|nr:uncharacterized protein MIND_00658100 [Mycena indigotica]KAF7300951.1 hypothetical protein MIND_00658100 [Mycena indigotica]